MKVFIVLLLATIATAVEEDWLWFDFEARIDFLNVNVYPIVDKDGNELQVGDILDGKFAVNLNAVCNDIGFSCTETYAQYPTGGNLSIPSILTAELATIMMVWGFDETRPLASKGFEILAIEQTPRFIAMLVMKSLSQPLADLNALDLSFFKSLELNWFDSTKTVVILYGARVVVSTTIVSITPEGHCVQNCAKIHQACMEECNMLSQAKKTCEEECKDDFEDCKSNCPRPNN